MSDSDCDCVFPWLGVILGVFVSLLFIIIPRHVNEIVVDAIENQTACVCAQEQPSSIEAE